MTRTELAAHFYHGLLSNPQLAANLDPRNPVHRGIYRETAFTHADEFLAEADKEDEAKPKFPEDRQASDPAGSAPGGAQNEATCDEQSSPEGQSQEGGGGQA